MKLIGNKETGYKTVSSFEKEKALTNIPETNDIPENAEGEKPKTENSKNK